ncbi:hypothetical protein EIP91_010890 [Steccherinum ochraceum]|uniref:Uncharacterized protein n=1 Tax=Steccherinum ochraceum TaxID=92696 RepID=A0A4R0RJ14_9APHY|nr:hypothetical protein EIP91_010890 [Steccherinum ochraceum]
MLKIHVQWSKSPWKAKEPASSLEALQRRFQEDEDARDRVFEQDRRMQLCAFAFAATPWTKGEDARNDQFRHFISNALETLSGLLEQQTKRFRDLGREHDEVFRTKDEARQKAFNEAGMKRTEVFREAHEMRKEEAREILQRLEKMYEDGRVQRRRECEELMGRLRGMFERLMREQEIALLERERLQRSQTRSDIGKAGKEDLEIGERGSSEREASKRRAPSADTGYAHRARRTSAIVVSERSRSADPSFPVFVDDRRARSQRTNEVSQDTTVSIEQPSVSFTIPTPDARDIQPQSAPVLGAVVVHHKSPSRPPAIMVCPGPDSSVSPLRDCYSPTCPFRNSFPYNKDVGRERGTVNPSINVGSSNPGSSGTDETASPPASSPSLPYTKKTGRLTLLDQKFNDREEKRWNVFRADEKAREDYVSEVKAFICGGSTRRQNQFDSLLQYFDGEATKMTQHHAKTTGSRVLEYESAESRRDAVFADSLAQMQITFDSLLATTEARCSVLEAAQDAHLAWCYNEVDGFLRAMDAAVDTLKTRAFSREDLFKRGLLISPSQNDNSTRPIPGSSMMTDSASPELAQSPHRARNRNRSPQRDHDVRRRYSSSYGPHAGELATPVFGDPFSPKILVEGNIFGKSLPVPPPHAGDVRGQQVPRPPVTSLSVPLTKMLRRHTSLFQRAQEQRSALFETQLHQYKHQIALLDIQASQAFKVQQVAFVATLFTAKLRHLAAFRDSLSASEHTLQDGDLQCERNFVRSTRTRAATFEDRESRRRQRWKWDVVVRDAVRLEASRARIFLAWKEEKLWETEWKVEAWRESFEEAVKKMNERARKE